MKEQRDLTPDLGVARHRFAKLRRHVAPGVGTFQDDLVDRSPIRQRSWLRRTGASLATTLGGRRPVTQTGRPVGDVTVHTTSPKPANSAFGESPYREVFVLAWPVTIAMLGDTAMGLVDTKLVAGLGSSAMGGVGIGMMLTYVCYAMAFGLMRGVKIRVSHAIGAGSPQDASRYVLGGASVGVVFGLLVFGLFRHAAWLLHGIGIDPLLVRPAQEFLQARTWGAPAICVLSALIQHRQALGDTKSTMRVSLAGNVVNGVLAWALIGGHLGLPALGVAGAGYATAIAETFMMLALGATLRSELRSIKSRSNPSSLSLSQAAKQVAELGVPTSVQFGLEMLAFTTFTAVLGKVGSEQIAAHYIALTVLRTSFLPGVAVSEAASILVGKSLGAKNLPAADRYTRASITIAVVFMAAMGVVFAWVGGSLARAFTDDSQVATIVRKLLLVAALFQVMDAVTIVLRGALRGAKDVKMVAVIGITASWVCIPTAAWWFGKHLGYGAVGGWFGFVGETTIAASLCWLRWSRGSWRKAYNLSVPTVQVAEHASAN